MTNYIDLGPILLPVKWLFVGLGLLVAYVVLKIRLKGSKLNGNVLLDTISNTAIIGFIVWKVSYAVFHPIYAMNNPIGILYFNGGERGLILAFIVSCVYLFFYAKKQKIHFMIYIDLILLAWISGSATFSLYQVTSNLIYFIGHITFAMIIVLIILTKKVDIGNKHSVFTIGIYYSFSQILLGYFSNKSPIILGFTLIQLIFILLAIFLIIATKQKRE